MHPAPIEVRGLQDDRPAVICQFPAESHRLAGEPAIKKAHRQIRSLRMVGCCAGHVRRADAGLAMDGEAHNRVEPSGYATLRLPKGFFLCGVIHLFSKDGTDTAINRPVPSKSIAGELESPGNLWLQSLQKVAAVLRVAFADIGMEDEF